MESTKQQLLFKQKVQFNLKESCLLVNYSFQEVIRSRQSIRQFLSTPVKEEVLREVLEDASIPHRIVIHSLGMFISFQVQKKRNLVRHL